MTNLQEAIEDAKRGGWQTEIESQNFAYYTGGDTIFLDPNFWKCLGKQRRWIKITYGGKPDDPILSSTAWLNHATRYFQDYAMQGRSPEDFFRELK